MNPHDRFVLGIGGAVGIETMADAIDLDICGNMLRDTIAPRLSGQVKRILQCRCRLQGVTNDY